MRSMLSSDILPIDELVDPVEVGLLGVASAIRESADGKRRGKVLVDPSAARTDVHQ